MFCRMDFTSERKRMSILVRDPKDDLIKLYIKGADSEITKRMSQTGQSPQIVQAVDSFVHRSSV